MSLQKPFAINLKGLTIDGNEDYLITWRVSGDIQVAYKIDIHLNTNNSLFFSSNKVNSYSLNYKLPANTLAIGVEYKVKVTIWNQMDESISSQFEVFKTSSKPVVTLSPIQTIQSDNYIFEASYFHNENIPMNSYTAFLYDSFGNLLDSSGVSLGIGNLEHLFNNLQSGKDYYVEFQASSANGLVGTTGKVRFSVSFPTPRLYLNLSGKNIENSGLEINWYILQIIGLADGNFEYINEEKISLINGTKVYFQEGFSADLNFTLHVWLENPLSKKDLIVLYGENGKISLYYDVFLQRFILKKEIGNIVSKWMSEKVSSGSYLVGISQIGSNMNISAIEN